MADTTTLAPLRHLDWRTFCTRMSIAADHSRVGRWHGSRVILLSRAMGVTESGSRDSSTPPKLLDRVRMRLRARHYSPRTEKAYVGWIRRFILFHHRRHSRDMGEREVAEFLTYLATQRRVAASTQNQAHGPPQLRRPATLDPSRHRETAARTRSRGWRRPRRHARRPGSQVSRSRQPVGVAVDLSRHTTVLGPEHGRATTAPSTRNRSSAGIQDRSPRGRHSEGRKLSYPTTQLRHAPTRGRLRHPHDPGATRPPRREHDNGLHLRAQPR